MNTTKLVIAVFAHPDDEAFGPSGTLLTEARGGSQVHLVTLTYGESGMNPDQHPDLAAVRMREWRRSGRLIGASGMHYMGYMDGQLDNNVLIEASQRIYSLAEELIASFSRNQPEYRLEVEFISNDLNGITGHVDHIVAARAAVWAFYRLQEQHRDDQLVTITRARLACLSIRQLPESSADWLYMEPGRPMEDIAETIDAREYREQIIDIMRSHHTQRYDGEQHIAERGDQIGLEHFIVLE